MYNHNAQFIASENSKMGIIEGNPIHKDMLYAAREARLDFIYVSEAPDDIVSDLHMISAHSVEEAITKAEEILNNKNSDITVIPDGVSVIVI